MSTLIICSFYVQYAVNSGMDISQPGVTNQKGVIPLRPPRIPCPPILCGRAPATATTVNPWEEPLQRTQCWSLKKRWWTACWRLWSLVVPALESPSPTSTYICMCCDLPQASSAYLSVHSRVCQKFSYNSTLEPYSAQCTAGIPRG